MEASSSENYSEILPDPSPPVSCHVCGLKSHGVHFGATTCRACAAFFRRVAAGANFVIKCQRGDGKCEILSNGRSCCKKCRLKKCKEIGMNIGNFQFDRDTINTSKTYTPSIAMFVGRPEFLLFRDPQSSSNINYIDLSDLLIKARKILKSCPKIMAKNRNRLHKMSSCINLNGLRESQQSSFTLISNMGYQESFSLWEHDLLLVTRWLTYFDEFQNLQPVIKMTFIKHMWHIWNRLEKLVRTAIFLKNQTNLKLSYILLTYDCIMDFKNFKCDIEWMTKYSLEQISYLIEGVGDFELFSTIQPILDLDPTDVEFNYMLAQVSFSFAAKRLGGEYAEVAENLLKVLADHLHDYYTEIGLLRYSERVVKMMKVNNSLIGVMRKRKEKLEIARTFNIFSPRFSEPEMFEEIM
ncbi:hypothetical protein B9Z55_017844 [Caenorhabditis nigoni]|uniref:Nuclear receptor domain-containing protein n=1 Tax=Caenorhabditis nigoni TaxID=1611254 RepID=A0A2G5TBH5_9PELO|nr:hypothetical protein B9Z55_017844 [Caenorhabditis nigoni]